MRPTTLQRKAALIKKRSSDANEWKGKSSQQIPLVGFTGSTLHSWMSGKTKHANLITLQSADKAIRQYLAENDISRTDLPGSDKNLLTDDVGVMTFGALLGLTRHECREAIDNMVGEVSPAFSIFAMTANESKSFMDQFCGHYLLYRVEKTPKAIEAERDILRISLSIRFPLGSHKVMSNHLQRIRCKMHILAYTHPIPDHEYDGFVTKVDGGGFHHWFFQTRKDDVADVIYMMTRGKNVDGLAGQPNERPYITGTMISRTQSNDNEAPDTAIWPFVMERVDPAQFLEEQEHVETTELDDLESSFMSAAPALLSSTEDIDEFIVRKLREAGDIPNFMRLEDT